MHVLVVLIVFMQCHVPHIVWHMTTLQLHYNCGIYNYFYSLHVHACTTTVHSLFGQTNG